MVAAALQFRAKRYGLLAGLVFFYLALLPSNRMTGIGGTPADLAERYLYFPTVGLAIALASGFSYLGRRHGSWPAITVALIALALLTPLTWNRNSDWANEVRLFESEYRRGDQGSQVLRLLTAAYLREGKPGEAAKICDAHPFADESLTKFATHCAIAYHQLGRNQDAERAFLLAARERSEQPVALTNLAQFYLRMGRRDEAKRQFERAVETENNPALRAYRRGEMLLALHPKNRRKLLQARSHFIEAVRLQPQLAQAQQRLDQLNRRLGPPP
jgi:tetratricopeptide (TPR) repeat protein